MARKKGKDRAGAGGLELTGEPVEVSDEPAEVIAGGAAIDVAKGSGMVCARVPHESRPHRRVQRTWQVSARYAEIAALMAELAKLGIQRLVLESTSDYVRREGA
jgi:transposase